MRPTTCTNKGRGFTLLEVLIAMLVTAIALLGVAKMQALAISSTKDSGSRSLIALQTASLAAMMHANKAYWTSTSEPLDFETEGATIKNNNAKLSAVSTNPCDNTTACAPDELAAHDVQAWVADMNAQFPSYTAKVDCDAVSPVSCTIYVEWTDKVVAMNKTTDVGTNQISTQSFSVYVKP